MDNVLLVGVKTVLKINVVFNSSFKMQKTQLLILIHLSTKRKSRIVDF